MDILQFVTIVRIVSVVARVLIATIETIGTAQRVTIETAAPAALAQKFIDSSSASSFTGRIIVKDSA
jgi:predicted cobalt transporter CbtA